MVIFNKNNSILKLISINLTLTSNIYPQEISYIKQIGNNAINYSNSFTIDSYDNSIILTGNTSGAFPDFTSSGGVDIFLIRLDSLGNIIWIKQFGTSFDDYSNSVTIDSTDRSIVIAGYTTGAFPGFTNSGAKDILVVKLDSLGNIIWINQFGTTSDENSTSVSIDSTDRSIVITGYTNGSLPGNTTKGGTDIFVVKLNLSGTIQWIRQIGASGTDIPFSVKIDMSDRSIVIAGYTYSTLPYNTNKGWRDIFILKLSSSGSDQWIKQFGGPGNEYSYGLVIDSTDNSIVSTGYTDNVLPNNISAGGKDIFVARLDSLGNIIWIKQFGSIEDDESQSVAIDSTDKSIVITGYTTGSLPNNTNTGGKDIFVAKLDSLGNIIWIKQFGSIENEHSYFVLIDSTDRSIVITGYTTGSLSGNISTGGQDIFIAKLTQLICDKSCFSCIENNYKCQSCSVNYYRKSDSSFPTNCYSSPPSNYRFDSNSNTFSTCYSCPFGKQVQIPIQNEGTSTCDCSCPSPLIEENGICLTKCNIPTHYNKNGICQPCLLPSFTYNQLCLPSCPMNSIVITHSDGNKYCVLCKNDYVLYKNECVLYNFLSISDKVQYCLSINKYLSKGECVSSCENGMYLYNNECLTQCPPLLYYDSSNRCIIDCKKFILNMRCIEICPSDYIVQGNICEVRMNNENNMLNSTEPQDNQDNEQDSYNKVLKLNITDENVNSITSQIDNILSSNTNNEDLINNSINSFINNLKRSNTIKLNTIKYKGKSLSMSYISNSNSEKEAIDNRLPLVNLTSCQNTLILNNILTKENSLSYLSIKVNTSDSPSENYFLIRDKYGNQVDTNLCKNIIYNLPIPLNDSSYISYLSLKNNISSTNIDIFNENSSFFYDVCIKTNNNNTDMSLIERQSKFNKTVSCSLGCKYDGIDDENGYFKCNCSSISEGSVNNFFTNSLFKQFVLSNFKVFLCYGNINFSKFFTSNFIFINVILMIYLVYIIVFIISIYRQSIYNDLDKILLHECSNGDDLVKISISSVLNAPIKVGNRKKKHLKHQNYIKINKNNQKKKLKSHKINDKTSYIDINTYLPEKVKTFQKKDQEINKVKIKSTLPSLTKINTLPQFNSLPILIQLEIDVRSQLVIYYHELLYNHEILNLFFYNSIINPFFIRLTLLFLCVLLKLAMSSLFFSDSYIKESNDYRNRVGPENTSWIFVITIQTMRILWPIMITILIKNILNYLILIPKDVNEEIKKYINNDTSKLIEGR